MPSISTCKLRYDHPLSMIKLKTEHYILYQRKFIAIVNEYPVSVLSPVANKY